VGLESLSRTLADVALNVASRRATRQAACVHRWMIEPPNGPTSEGCCANCGEVRLFPNSGLESIGERWNVSYLGDLNA
jgi:hypothetical protein